MRAKVAAPRDDRDATMARMEEVRQARAAAARAAGETEAVRRLLRTLGDRARNADAKTRTEMLRLLVKGAKVERVEDRCRLSVYRFSGEVPAFTAADGTDTGSSPR